MSASLRKEIRLLLPAWIAAFVLVIVPECATAAFWSRAAFWWPGYLQNLVYPAGLGLVLLCLAPFGQEFSHGTFSLLLAQPAERVRIWRMKVGLLAVASGSIVAAFLVWVLMLGAVRTGGAAMALSAGRAGPFVALALAVVSGGLWTTLLFRQVVAAFAFTLLLPAAIWFSLLGLWSSRGPEGIVESPLAGRVADVGLLLYAAAGFWWARRLFLRAQDVQWTGGVISLPGWLAPATKARAAVGVRRGPWRALIVKELQLQHLALLLAGFLAILHLLFIGFLGLHPSVSEKSLAELLGSLWLLWLVTPIVVGAVAVAEERRLGVLGTHLCLPIPRRVQFGVKFTVALLVGILVGTLVPWTLETLTGVVNPAISVRREVFGATSLGMGLALRSLYSAALVVLSLYASSLARNTLHALGGAFVLVVVSGLVIIPINFATEPDFFLQRPVWFWTYLVGLPLVVVTLLGLSYANYKRQRERSQTWRLNLVALAAASLATTAVANGIYQRAWERVLPLEPRHGPARFSLGQPPTLQLNRQVVVARLPDGRVWLCPIGTSTHSSPLVRLATWGFSSGYWEEWPLSLHRPYFAPGSNWTQTAAAWRQVLGLRSDGSLWSLQADSTNQVTRGLVRIGADHDWLAAAGGGFGFLLLKKDGTLWWKPAYSSSAAQRETLFLRPPERFGRKSDWDRVFRDDWTTCARQSDGRVWATSRGQATDPLQAPGLVRRPDLDGKPWSSLTRFSFGYNSQVYSLEVGVRADGSMWVWRRVESELSSIRTLPNAENSEKTAAKSRAAQSRPIQIGKDRRWRTVWIGREGLFALGRDGTIWNWKVRWDQPLMDAPSLIASERPARRGVNSDWAATTPTFPGLLTLAADGSVWQWGERFGEGRLFVPSRIPKRVASILSDTNTH